MKKVLVSAFLVGMALGYPRLYSPWGGEGTVVNIAYLTGSGIGFAILGLTRYLLAKIIGRIASWAVFLALYVILAMYRKNQVWSSFGAGFNAPTSSSHGVLFPILFVIFFILIPIILSKIFGTRGLFIGLVILNVAAESFRLQSEWQGSGVTLNIELLLLAALAGFFWAVLAWGVGSFFAPEKAKTRYQATHL